METRTGVVPRDHVVQFYARDDELVSSVAEFLIEGLLAGEVAIVVATPAHAAAFEAAIARAGVDATSFRTFGDLIIADAAGALSTFMVDGWPEADAFANEIGDLIGRAAGPGRHVRIYGEMVALLWDAGNVAGAIELESLWNDLGRRIPFSLFCAYPAHTATDGEHAESFRHVCHLHSAVVAHSSMGATATDTVIVSRAENARSFPCELYAPGVARHFVADTLAAWHRERLVDDASIIVAELATNAVLHARSEFIVAVSTDGDVVRLSVRDASSIVPTLKDPSPNAISGRGLMLIASIARRWGIELIDDGKVVWAELGPR